MIELRRSMEFWKCETYSRQLREIALSGAACLFLFIAAASCIESRVESIEVPLIQVILNNAKRLTETGRYK